MKWFAFFSTLLFSIVVLSNTMPDIGNSNSLNHSTKQVKLPEFTHQAKKDWINSKPLSVKKLLLKSNNKNKILLIDMWTFDCWNCYRSFPWLNELEKKYQQQGLQVIGVHTPEFDHEKIRSNIEEKVKKFKLHHPIMIDNDFSYWRALNNRYWPTYYLVDQDGTIVYQHIGETHHNDRKAIALEQKIKQLLKIK